jgi:hypothetical protein
MAARITQNITEPMISLHMVYFLYFHPAIQHFPERRFNFRIVVRFAFLFAIGADAPVLIALAVCIAQPVAKRYDLNLCVATLRFLHVYLPNLWRF